MSKTLAYLGPPGTFSHHAARTYLARQGTGNLTLRPLTTIPAIFQALLAREVDLALLPAENSIEGSVTATMDLLAQDLPLHIQGELVLPVEQQLLSQAVSLAEVTAVYSHPQALAQCRIFLATKLPHARLEETTSTAEAARLVKEGGPGLAAIASKECGESYGLPTLAANIADYANNETRFLLIGQELTPHPDSVKTSLVLSLASDHPGGLYQVLGLFARENINLSRIESRPAKSALGKYFFFIDCEAGSQHPGLKKVLAELAPLTSYLRNLGSYPSL